MAGTVSISISSLLCFQHIRFILYSVVPTHSVLNFEICDLRTIQQHTFLGCLFQRYSRRVESRKIKSNTVSDFRNMNVTCDTVSNSKYKQIQNTSSSLHLFYTCLSILTSFIIHIYSLFFISIINSSSHRKKSSSKFRTI